MQTYEVTGKHITIGIGTEIKLSESQAEGRNSSLKNKKKDVFEVVEPVQFKRGEKITISPKNLTKSLLENMKEISDKKTEGKNEANADYPRIQHAGSGKYNVYDKNKNLITSKSVKKHEAEKLLSEILAQDQADDDSDDDENDEESDSGNLGNV